MVLVSVTTETGQDGTALVDKQIDPIGGTTANYTVQFGQTQNYLYSYLIKNPYPATTPTGTETQIDTGRPYFIFRGITIPNSAVIIDATLSFFALSDGGAQFPNATTPVIARIYGRKTASPVLYDMTGTQGTGVFTRTDNATAFGQFTVTYNQTSLVEQNVDMKDVVQELVDAFNYNNDNMFFFMKSTLVFPTTTAVSYTVSSKIAIQARQSAQPFEIPSLVVNYLVGQSCRPISDISNVGVWEDTTFGNGDTDLFNELDDVIEDDEVSAVRSKQSADIADTFEVQLENCTDPVMSVGHVLRVRARGIRDQIKIQLYQGAVLIAESGEFVLSGEFATYEYLLSGGEADAITDYNDLRIRVVPSVVP